MFRDFFYCVEQYDGPFIGIEAHPETSFYVVVRFMSDKWKHCMCSHNLVRLTMQTVSQSDLEA